MTFNMKLVLFTLSIDINPIYKVHQTHAPIACGISYKLTLYDAILILTKLSYWHRV